MSTETVQGGTCRRCGRDLVQTPDRTYHPAAVMPADDPCPDLLPMPSTPWLKSFNVPPANFVLERGAASVGLIYVVLVALLIVAMLAVA